MKNLIVLGIIAGIVFLIFQYPHKMLSPGELIQGHQDLNNNCIACHAPFGGIPNDKCIACHKLSEIGVKNVKSDNNTFENNKILFHQNLATQSCVACHSDHKGTNPVLISGQFKHDLLTENARNNCLNCHAKPTDNLHAQISSACISCHNFEGWKSATFNHAMLLAADKNNCAACHKKPKDAMHASSDANCNQCHTTTKWVPSTFDHASYFVLDGNHNTKCAVCHINNVFTTYTCYGCHEHTPNNILSEHNEEGIYNINNCVRCHKSANEGDENGGEGRGEGRGEGGDRDD